MNSPLAPEPASGDESIAAPHQGRLRAAVIGTGKISDEHLSFLAARSDVDLVGVCDLSATSADFARTRFGAEASFTDHRAMLESCGADVVHVLTPPATHVPIAMDCLNAGAHVFVEKPVALDRASFRALWEHARSKGRVLVENQNYRFNAPIRQALAMAQAGELGDVTDVEVRMALPVRSEGSRYADRNLPAGSHKLPAGVIHEFITHVSYLALMFLGGFDRVNAIWSNHEGDELFKYDDLDAIVLNGCAHARIRFTCRTWPDAFTVTVRGTEATVVADIFQPHLYVDRPRGGGSKFSPMVNRFVNGKSLMKSSWTLFWDKVLQRTAYEGLARLLDETYSALREGTAPPVAFAEIDGTIALVDALLEGAES